MYYCKLSEMLKVKMKKIIQILIIKSYSQFKQILSKNCKDCIVLTLFPLLHVV